MKIYFCNLEKTEEKDIWKVNACHYKPFDEQYGIKDEHGEQLTKEKLEEDGFFTEDNLKISYIENHKIYNLFYNKETKEYFYKCTGNEKDMPKSREQIKQTTIEQIQQAIAELSMNLTALKGGK